MAVVLNDHMPACCVLQLAWNPNLGSHHWLAVAGNAGLLRILCVRTVGSSHAARRYVNPCSSAQSSVNGAG